METLSGKQAFQEDVPPESHDPELRRLIAERDALRDKLAEAEQTIAALRELADKKLSRLEHQADSVIQSLNLSKGWWLMLLYRLARVTLWHLIRLPRRLLLKRRGRPEVGITQR